MEFGLDQEQRLVVDTVRSFVEKELYPLEDEVERTGKVPRAIGREIQDKVRALGFYAPNIPEEFGGGGLDHLTFTLLERELGRGVDGALGLLGPALEHPLRGATPGSANATSCPACGGEKIDALAMTEPDAGSDVRGMKTFARRDGSDFVINGTKHFISHADLADFVITFVATGEEETRAGTKKRITCFLVDRGTPGFEIRPGYNAVSHRGYHNCILVFDDCGCPPPGSSARRGPGSRSRTPGWPRRA